jgi:hypothetical protein
MECSVEHAAVTDAAIDRDPIVFDGTGTTSGDGDHAATPSTLRASALTSQFSWFGEIVAGYRTGRPESGHEMGANHGARARGVATSRAPG